MKTFEKAPLKKTNGKMYNLLSYPTSILDLGNVLELRVSGGLLGSFRIN
jgi:hypothetical protein